MNKEQLLQKYSVKIVNGKALSHEILEKEKGSLAGKRLAIILASEDQSSKVYVKMKAKKAEEYGVEVELYEFDQTTSLELIIEKLIELNANDYINGVMVQLPLFDHIKNYSSKILSLIDFKKDVDGLRPDGVGNLIAYPTQTFLPATVSAVLEVISRFYDKKVNSEYIAVNGYEKVLKGVVVSIINDSMLIGKPLALILSQLGATVTLLNEFSRSLSEFTINSDIVISATGKTGLIDHKMIKTDSLLIDVTSVKVKEEILGDGILSEELLRKVKGLTPVPGGIGPLTIACLLRNLANT